MRDPIVVRRSHPVGSPPGCPIRGQMKILCQKSVMVPEIRFEGSGIKYTHPKMAGINPMKTTMKITQSKQVKPSGKQGNKPTKVTGPQEEIQKAMSEEQTAEVATLNRLHDEIFQESKMTTEKAIDLGGRLVELKQSLGHGNWLPFVEAHLTFSDKTAKRYMKVYENREKLTAKFDNVSNFALMDAYRFVAETKKSAPGGQQAPSQAEVQKESDKNAVMKELSRSVREQLKPLSAERISQFKEDLVSFMRNWLERHVGGSENVTELKPSEEKDVLRLDVPMHQSGVQKSLGGNGKGTKNPHNFLDGEPPRRGPAARNDSFQGKRFPGGIEDFDTRWSIG